MCALVQVRHKYELLTEQTDSAWMDTNLKQCVTADGKSQT